MQNTVLFRKQATLQYVFFNAVKFA